MFGHAQRMVQLLVGNRDAERGQRIQNPFTQLSGVVVITGVGLDGFFGGLAVVCCVLLVFRWGRVSRGGR